MTGRSWNGTQPENGTSPESGRQPEGGQSQGSLLVREAEQVSPPAEEVELGPAGAGAESLASAAPQPDELRRALPSRPVAKKPLWRRLMDRARHVFGSSHFVDDMLECAPVGTYAAMADEVLGSQQSGAQRSGSQRSGAAAGSRDMHPSR